MTSSCCGSDPILFSILSEFPGDDNGREFRREAARRINDVIEPSQTTEQTENSDTVVYPLVQMGPFEIQTDCHVTEEFFRKTPPSSTVHLASGYFNLTSHYRSTLIGYSAANYNILTAAPEVAISLLFKFLLVNADNILMPLLRCTQGSNFNNQMHFIIVLERFALPNAIAFSTVNDTQCIKCVELLGVKIGMEDGYQRIHLVWPSRQCCLATPHETWRWHQIQYKACIPNNGALHDGGSQYVPAWNLWFGLSLSFSLRDHLVNGCHIFLLEGHVLKLT